MPIKSILVATDLSVRESHAMLRAQQLAAAHRATLKLMYLPHAGDAPVVSASRQLAAAARQLEEDLPHPVWTVPVRGQGLDGLVAEARGADLVVLPHRLERSVTALLRGQPVVQFLRECSVPVLVTRQAPATRAYERIVVGVDLSDRAAALARFAADLDAVAQLHLYHAIDTSDEARLRSAEAPEHAISTYSERRLALTQRRMRELTHSLGCGHRGVLTVIGRGDAGWGTALQQNRAAADLVVVGKKRSSAWRDFVCGSVAQRVLGRGTSDVLVVPDAWLQDKAHALLLRARRRAGVTLPVIEGAARTAS